MEGSSSGSSAPDAGSPGGQIYAGSKKGAVGTLREGAGDGVHELMEVEAGAMSQVARYDYDPSRIDALLGQVSGSKAHVASDGLGSVYALTGTTSAMLTKYGYDVYGTRTAGVEAVTTPWGSSGRRVDPAGVAYYRERYYSSNTGGWLSADPAGFSDGTNLYRFVSSNPTNGIDPFGLKTLVITGFPYFGTDHLIYRTRFSGATWEDLLRDMLERAGLVAPQPMRFITSTTREVEVRTVFSSGSLDALAAEVGTGIEPVDRVIWVGHLAPCGQGNQSTCLNPGEDPNRRLSSQLITPGSFTSFLKKVNAYGGSVIGCGDVSPGTPQTVKDVAIKSGKKVCFTNTRIDFGYDRQLGQLFLSPASATTLLQSIQCVP